MLKNLTLLVVALVGLATGCTSPGPEVSPSLTPSPTTSGSPSPEPSQVGGPSKEAALSVLLSLARAIEAGQVEEASKLVMVPKGMPPEEIGPELKKSLERGEISVSGVEKLGKLGSYGTAREIFEDRADNWAKKTGVDPEQCWAFSFQEAEAVLFWDGSAFKAIRFDDIGKLTENKDDED